MAYRVSGRARQDVFQIWQYIAHDNQAAADRFIELLVRHIRLIGSNPYIGRRRNDLREGLRTFPVGEYLIIYRISQNMIWILRVLHGRRDLPYLLKP